MNPSANWKGLSVPYHGLNVRTGASDVTDTDFSDYPAFTELNNGQEMGENTNMFWLYDTGTFPLNNLIDDWSICYTAVANSELSLSNIGVFTMNIDEPTYTTDNNDNNGIMFYNSNGYMRIANNVPPSYGTPQLNDRYRFYCPPYNNSRYVWTPDADGATSDQGYLDFYGGANVEGYAAPYKTFGIRSLFLEIRVYPTNTGGQALPLSDYSLKEYMLLSEEARQNNPIAYAYARVHRRGNTEGIYTADGNGYDINAAITVPFHGNGYENIGAYFNNVYYRVGLNLLFLPLFGNASGERDIVRYNKQDNTADIFYGYDRIDYRHIYSDTSDEREYIFAMSGTEENAEYLRRSCAAYGLFFCDDIHTSDNKNLAGSELEANNGRWLHNDMYLGIIEESGYTEGRYTRGIENGLQAQFNWKDSTESTYDPDLPPVPENDYSTETEWHVVSDLTTMTQRYVLNAAAVQHLGRELWTISSDLIDDGQGSVDYNNLNDKMLDTFLTQNPIDCIVDLRRYPLEIPKGSSTLLKLGKYETTVAGYVMSKTAVAYTFTMQKKIMPLFGDSFLDYEPYTHFELYIPFCGTVSLEPADILGRKLSVRLVVDFTTGTATAYVLSDKLVIKSAQGQIAIDIPVSGIQSVTAASQISNAIIDARVAKAGEIGAVGNLASVSGITRMLTNPFQTGAQISQAQWQQDRADYNLTHQNISPHTIGAASSASAWAIDLNCRLLIYYPTGAVLTNDNPPEFITSKLQEYGQTTGFACCLTGQLKSFSGLTVGLNIKMNNIRTNKYQQPATLQELQMIEAAVEEGVIL